MITLIPALDVMKAMTDNNVTSPASHDRRKAFHHIQCRNKSNVTLMSFWMASFMKK